MENVLANFGTCNVNSPIDISGTRSLGKCVDKCDLTFKYNISSVNITNHGDYLNVKYDDVSNSDAQVTFNSKKYKVTDLRIYSPSLHTYNGNQMPAEILIIHTPVDGGNQLFVSVPIMNSNSVNAGSTMISAILTHALANAPADGNESRLDNIKNFSLNSVVPKKPYYYYSGVNFLNQPCSAAVDIVCYLPYTANIGINTDLVDKLSFVIKPSNITPKPYTEGDTPRLYFNEEGATSSDSNGSDDIVISCQPYDDTGDPNETTDYVVDTDSSPLNPSDIFNSGWFQVIAGSFIFFLIICLLNFIFGIFQKNSESSGAASNPGSMLSFLNKK